MDFGLTILIMLGTNLQRVYKQILAREDITAEARTFAEDGLKVVLELRDLVTSGKAITQEQRSDLAAKFDALSVRAAELKEAGVTLV